MHQVNQRKISTQNDMIRHVNDIQKSHKSAVWLQIDIKTKLGLMFGSNHKGRKKEGRFMYTL